MAAELTRLGHRLVTGGTDNHMILVDLRARGVTGAAAQDALERCGIVVNKNLVPADELPSSQTSGLRIGTNSIAFRGMGTAEAVRCAQLVDDVLQPLIRTGSLPTSVERQIRTQVRDLCAAYPVDPSWPAQ